MLSSVYENDLGNLTSNVRKESCAAVEGCTTRLDVRLSQTCSACLRPNATGKPASEYTATATYLCFAACCTWRSRCHSRLLHWPTLHNDHRDKPAHVPWAVSKAGFFRWTEQWYRMLSC